MIPVTTESRPTGPGSVPETGPAIEVRRLRKIYRATVAVDDVSFSVRDGEIFGILGPNGAGKTTTVECMIGLRRPDAGDIRVMGLDPQADREDLHMIVGAQLQASALPAQLKVGEILDLYHSFYAEAADLAEIMDSLGLAEKQNAYYKSLSGGLKQRLSIALALIGNPKVAVLDEMTTGLDPQARRDTWHLIEQVRDRDVTIILVTHYMDEAERLCDRIALLDRGRIVAIDTPDGLAGRAGVDKRVRFVPSKSFDDHLLAGLPEVTATSDSTLKIRRAPLMTAEVNVKWYEDGTTLQVAPGEVWILQGINALTIYPKVRHTLSRAFAPAS